MQVALQEEPSPPPDARPRLPGATLAIAVLTGINLLNYVDRYVPSSVKELFKRDLHLTDAETSLPLTAFVFVYMLASPVFGVLADRFDRRRLIAIGVALWSVATATAALATGLWSLLVPRAAVGVGEAAYATLAPAILSDFYRPDRRNRILTVFNVAIPVGAAIGFKAGGWIGQTWGWRTAFLVCGIPGLVAAALVLFIRDPGRRSGTSTGATLGPWRETLRELARNRQFIYAVGGYAAVTFAAGALADWFPTFLVRYRHYDISAASGLTGVTAAGGGLIGTALGGALGDALRKRIHQPYLAVSAWTSGLAIFFVLLALNATDHTVIAFAMFTGQILLWCYNGPINTLIVNSVAAPIRVRAIAVSLFFMHILGDATSPTLVGLDSDFTNSLMIALRLVIAALAIAAFVWLYAQRTVDEVQH